MFNIFVKFSILHCHKSRRGVKAPYLPLPTRRGKISEFHGQNSFLKIQELKFYYKAKTTERGGEVAPW